MGTTTVGAGVYVTLVVLKKPFEGFSCLIWTKNDWLRLGSLKQNKIPVSTCLVVGTLFSWGVKNVTVPANLIRTGATTEL